MNLIDLLPQDFWSGPPLPKFMNVFWPWVKPSSSTSTGLSNLFNGSPSSDSSQSQSQSTPAYENLEEIEFPDGFDPETLMPRKIIVHRKYKKRVD